MIIVRILQRKHLTLNFVSSNENDSACTQHEQIEPKVRNSSSSTCAFSLHFGWQLKIDSRSTRYPFCLRFWVKVRKPFQSSSFRQVRNSCSVQKWFKVHKVRILPSLWLKVRKSFVCCQINLSFKLAIQVSEGTHCTLSFWSKLQNPQIITQNDNYKKWVIWASLTARTLTFVIFNVTEGSDVVWFSILARVFTDLIKSVCDLWSSNFQSSWTYKMNIRYAHKQIWSYKCMFTESCKLHKLSSIDMFLAQNTHSIII